MNSFTYQQLALGQSHRFTVTINDKMMSKFYEVTGDNSPIHMSDEAAAARGYRGRVVYGMLGASFFSTLAGVWLPGRHCLLHGVEVKFARPVYIGDTLTIHGEITEKNDTFKTITMKAHITNQHGQKVTRGVIKAGLAQ